MFIYVVYSFRNLIEQLYIEFNHPFVIFKREFKDLSYFEKLFLVLFHRNGLFEHSFANIFDKKNIVEYRKKNYPLIFFFHMYYGRMSYKFDNLNLLVRQYKYFNFNRLFKFKLNYLKLKFFKQKNFKSSNFVYFLILQKLLYKRYYNLCSSTYFKKYSYFNTLKLNWLFHTFILRANGKFYMLDLNDYSDWYQYNFDNKYKKLQVKPILLDKSYRKSYDFFNKVRFLRLEKIFKFYNTKYKKISIVLGRYYKNIYLFRFIPSLFNKIKINESWKKSLITYYPIRFSESAVVKHINYNKLDKYSIFYLRKNRIFNKGRYSRNRQLYRTGVYWCLWLSIILVYGLYFLFYRFSFNFGYIWWGILILAYSTIFSRIIKYKFYNIYYLINEFVNLIKWLGYLVVNVKALIFNIFNKLLLKFNIMNYLVTYKNYKFNFIFNLFELYFIRFFTKWLESTDAVKFVFFWEGMKEKDNSFLRYKTIIHWFKQFYKMLIT
jgi:hypothetical protein